MLSAKLPSSLIDIMTITSGQPEADGFELDFRGKILLPTGIDKVGSE